MHIRIGTRASPLAIEQTMRFIQVLQSVVECTYEVVKIITTGDKIQDKKLYDIGGKALFLKEIEEALLLNKIDCAVHSMKDVPGKLPYGLSISAVLKRENPYDVLISNVSNSLSTLPKNAVIATSSARRKASIIALRNDIEIVDIRGNIQTRLDKWRNQKLDGTILAAAGLERMNLFDKLYCHIIDPKEMLPSVGQGIIALETRADDHKMIDLCKKINHIPTWNIMKAERGFLEYLDASCATPLAAFAEYRDNKIHVDYMLANDECQNIVKTQAIISDINGAYDYSTEVAKSLKQELDCSF